MPDAAAIVAMAAAMLCLRAGWGGPRAATVVGWTLAAAGLALLGARWGAWGLAVACLAAMLAALALLGREASAGETSRRPPPRAAPSVTPPRWRPRGLARRVAVFTLVAPVGLAASELLALGAEAAARRAGWVEADTTALAFMVAPVTWAVLASVQLMCAGPRGMIAPALLCAATGGVLWWL